MLDGRGRLVRDRYAQLFSADDIAVLYLVDQAVAADPSKLEHCDRIRMYEAAALAEQAKERFTVDTSVLLQREAKRFAPHIAPGGNKGPAAAAERQRKFAHLVMEVPQAQQGAISSCGLSCRRAETTRSGRSRCDRTEPPGYPGAAPAVACRVRRCRTPPRLFSGSYQSYGFLASYPYYR